MPVMRKSLYDSLSRDTMLLINTEQWSSDKDVTHPIRSEENVDSFTEIGKFCKKRALLECERRFFDNKTENDFVERNDEFSMNLLGRERAMLILDKRICWGRGAFNNVMQWSECKTELKCYCIKCYFQTKVHERDKNIKLTTMSRVQNT